MRSVPDAAGETWKDSRDREVEGRFGYRPQTANQQTLVDLVRGRQLTFVVGPSGSGKTLLSAVEAVNSMRSGATKRIVCVRPLVDCGPPIGFRPGDEGEKAASYMRGLVGKLTKVLGKDEFRLLTEAKKIEVTTLQSMRGDEFESGHFVILDEAQNVTVPQMKMFLTRIGAGSKVVVAGDPEQIDLREPSGLDHALDCLSPSALIGFARLDEVDILRSELVREILRQW